MSVCVSFDMFRLGFTARCTALCLKIVVLSLLHSLLLHHPCRVEQVSLLHKEPESTHARRSVGISLSMSAGPARRAGVTYRALLAQQV